MGKNPEIILTGSVNDKPYMGILDSIESGSREAYRKQIESSRVDDFIEADEVELETENSGQTTDDGDNGSNRISTEGVPVRQLGKPDSGSENGDCGQDSWDSVDGQGFVAHAQETEKEKAYRRQRGEEIRKARAEAKRRRFAARAVGATNVRDLPFLVEWKIIDNIHSEDFGKFKFKLIHPKDLTEKVLERVLNSNDPTRHAEALERAAAKLAATMDNSQGG